MVIIRKVGYLVLDSKPPFLTARMQAWVRSTFEVRGFVREKDVSGVEWQS